MSDDTRLSTNVGVGDLIKTLDDGTRKWCVGVPGMVTEVGDPDTITVPVAAALADATVNPISYLQGSCIHWFNGATWDLARGDAANGLLVNLGTNNDVTITSGTLTAVTTITDPVAVTNAALAVVGGGAEATALRVTIASDSTGVLSVDDNGGSLTVDGTVAVSGVGGTVTVANGGTFAVQAAQAGTWNVNNISGTVSLPTGAATAVKQPALGTAGSASADVITVQGVTSMTPLLVNGSGVTQPVSGTVAATQSGTWNIATVTAVTAITNALPTGTNNIGDVDILTIAAGDNNIGNVDIVTVPADPFGLNADAASATGSISAKLRFIASTGIPITGTVTVGTHAVTQSGTWNIGTVTTVSTVTAVSDAQVQGKAAHDAAASGNPILFGAYASAAAPADVSSDGDAVRLWSDRAGRLQIGDGGGSITVDGTVAVSGTVTVGTHDVTNAGTFAVQVTGDALTSLQLIDDVVHIDDTATHTTGATKGILFMAAATPTDGSVNANDIGAVAMTVDRKLHVSLQDALPAGTNNIGDIDILTIAAGDNNIGNVDIVTVPADPFGVNADAASATGSISAKLRFIASTGIPITGTVTVSGTVTANAGTNLNTSLLALESGGNLAGAATSLAILDDWDESDRAKVNIIVGQAGVTAGAGSVAANTPRVTLASDDPAVAALQIMDDWDNAASDGASVSGDVAHDTADAGEPVKQGFKATTSLSALTMVSNNDRTNGFAGVDGVQITRMHCNLEDIVSGNASNTDGASTSVIATAGAGIKQYLTKVTLTNTSSSNIYVEIKSGTTVRWTIPVPATGGADINFNPPLPPNAADEAWNFDPSAATSTIYCSALGFKSKI